MVVFGSFVCYFIADGWAYSFGVVFTDLLNYFDESKGKTATIGALIYAVPLLISPLPCALCNLYGTRPVTVAGGCICAASFIISTFVNSLEMLMLTLGVAVSVGLALTYVPAILSVTYYFETRRGLAVGLAVTGSGLGAFAFAPFMQHLLKIYSWRGTMLVLGGLTFHIVAAGLLFFPLRKRMQPPDDAVNNDIELLDSCSIRQDNVMKIELEEKEHLNNSSNNSAGDRSHCGRVCSEVHTIRASMCDTALYRNGLFILYCVSGLLCYMWAGTPYVYLYDKARLLGFSDTDAAWLLSAIGISRTVGQVLLGSLADLKQVNTVLLYAVSIFLCGLATALLPHCTIYPLLLTYATVFGFFISVTYALQILCIVELCGMDKATNAFGIYQLIQGLATLLGTPIPGECSAYMYSILRLVVL